MIDKIKKIMSEFTEMETGEMTKDTQLISDMELSSFDIANIAAEIEEEFSIEISDKALKEFNTIGDVVDYIENNI